VAFVLRTVPVDAGAVLMPPSVPGQDQAGTTVLRQEFGAGSLSGLRAAVLECALAAGLGDDRAIDVMLALHELAANTVRHGRGQGLLRIDVTDRALRCQVSEAGLSAVDARAAGLSAVDATAAGLAAAGGPVTGSFLPAPDWPVQHGHGLWLVRRTADLVQVTSGPGGTVVSVSFNRPAG
jgi:anti-sigma regulatory factor (Ser/Thr protein kinase)